MTLGSLLSLSSRENYGVWCQAIFLKDGSIITGYMSVIFS
jgi:hypothetical protein